MNGIKHPLELLADWVELELAWIAAPSGSDIESAALDATQERYYQLLSLDPTTLRALALSSTEESA